MIWRSRPLLVPPVAYLRCFSSPMRRLLARAARDPPWHGYWSVARCKGGLAMRKFSESLRLVLARIRRLFTGLR